MARRWNKRWTVSSVALAGFAISTVPGCHVPHPQGAPISATPVGSVLDHANRYQEENAEKAKFIIYMHEFELNQPFELPTNFVNSEEYQSVPIEIPRGFRLTPYGQDHVRQIARALLDGTNRTVVVERSQTSKLWRTVHRYPVHWNPELDEHRRAVVVEALLAFGVERADELVHIAPAFPAGLHSDEAAQAYTATLSNNAGGGQGGLSTSGQGGQGGQGGGFGTGF